MTSKNNIKSSTLAVYCSLIMNSWHVLTEIFQHFIPAQKQYFLVTSTNDLENSSIFATVKLHITNITCSYSYFSINPHIHKSISYDVIVQILLHYIFASSSKRMMLNWALLTNKAVTQNLWQVGVKGSTLDSCFTCSALQVRVHSLAGFTNGTAALTLLLYVLWLYEQKHSATATAWDTTVWSGT